MHESKRERYLGIGDNSLGKKYDFILTNNLYIPIGQGGSGIVYAANQVFGNNIYVKRAVKFFIFRDDLMETWGYISKDNFDTEIKNISRFNHQNILKVVDGDYYNIIIDGKEVKIPYTVTEFIDGPNLDELFDEKNRDLCMLLFNE